AAATANVRTLCQLLKGNPAHAAALRAYGRRILHSRRHASLYTEIGVLSNDAVFTELKRRILFRQLPPAAGDESLADGPEQGIYKKPYNIRISAVARPAWLA